MFFGQEIKHNWVSQVRKKKNGIVLKNFIKASALFSCLLYSWDTFGQEIYVDYRIQKLDTSQTLTKYGYSTIDWKLVIAFGKYYYTNTIRTIGFVVKKGSGLSMDNT